MKKIIKFTFCLLILAGCSNDNNLLDDIATRGGFIQFKEVPTLSLNILETDTNGISEELFDPNNNATSYSLALYYNGMEVQNFKNLNSFPNNLDISVTEVVNALGITLADITLGTKFTFVATIVTPTGTYSGFTPNYDANNVNQGGDSTVRLKAVGLRDAIEFDIEFFLPPAKKVRGTSFENVTIGSNNIGFTRTGGVNETADLINGANPPYVDYTATGSSTDDEIGFNTEYFAVPNISSSGLGFRTERIGVYSLFEDYTEYPDGIQGYHSEDVDGGLRITFDTVEIPANQNQSGVSFDVYFNDTSWESRDGLYAYANVIDRLGNAQRIDIVQIFDNDVEAVAGSWRTYVINGSGTGFLRDIQSYQLVIEIQSGATSESFDIDNVIVYVPEN